MVARVAFVIGPRKSPPRKTSETSLYFQTLKVTGGGGKNHLNICCRLWSQPRPPFVSLEVPAGYKLVRCQEFNHMFVFRRTKNEKRRRILQTFCQQSDFIASSCWGNESRWIDWKVHSLIRTSLILRDNFLLFVSMTSLLVWIFFFLNPHCARLLSNSGYRWRMFPSGGFCQIPRLMDDVWPSCIHTRSPQEQKWL